MKNRLLKRHVMLQAELPCSVGTTFDTDDIEGTPQILPEIAKLNVGDYVHLSGDLVSHDEEAQGKAASIEWGSILWGPFGGLDASAFSSPALRFKVSEFSRG